MSIITPKFIPKLYYYFFYVIDILFRNSYDILYYLFQLSKKIQYKEILS